MSTGQIPVIGISPVAFCCLLEFICQFVSPEGKRGRCT